MTEPILLVMFDIDGTLVTGNGIDDDCFCEAIRDVLGVEQFDTNWSHYLNITESGITSEIVEKGLSKKVDESDVQAVHHSYLTKLRREIDKRPHSFQAIPGASELIADLMSMDNVRVCIATGGWGKPALLKLDSAGIRIGDIPMASSDDSDKRLSIMVTAYERSRVCYSCPEFKQVVYIADTVGDFKNAKQLGYSFVGIGNADKAERLRNTGAIQVIPDFTDKVLFLKNTGIHRYG
jgi:phosphoglycolate phosphatase-like HAD superfamily hydrolase